MKKNLYVVLGLLFSLIASTELKAQLSAKLAGCNSIRAEMTKRSEQMIATSFAYILEREIKTDVWMSVQKDNDRESAAHFKHLKPGLYRVKFVKIGTHQIAGETIPSVSDPVVVKGCSESYDLSQTKVLATPNPVSNTLEISLQNVPEGEKIITLVNAQGTIVKTFTLSDDTFSIQVLDFPKGIYFLNLQMGNRNVARERIVIN